MKNFIFKLLQILLIISAIGIVIWLIGVIGEWAMNGTNTVLRILFYIFGSGLILILIYFGMKPREITPAEKDMSKMLKENISNEIQKKHSS